MAATTRGPRRPPRSKQDAAATIRAASKRAAKAPVRSKALNKAPMARTSRVKTSQVKPAARTKKASSTGKPSLIATALAAFAHEVRTPLTGILAISDMLATSDLPERERQWVATIKEGAEHLASLATLFVDSAQGESSAWSLRRERFDLPALVRAAGDSLLARATAKGLTVDVTVARTLPAMVTGDAVRLRAALENLIDNAVKFTEAGSVDLDVAARARNGQVTLTFTVSDSGIGLSLPDIRRLFRPFSQANLGIATRFGGAGLGLWSVRQIARSMGGDIAVAARKGGGSAFTLTVTLDQAARSRVKHADTLQPLNILCVEDNPFGRVVFKAVLTELGHSVAFTESGAKASSIVARENVDLILMDMVLPDISGIKAIRNIRALGPPRGATPIIGVSGREQDRAEALAAGANAFAVKPVSPRELATLLSQVTRARPRSARAND